MGESTWSPAPSAETLGTLQTMIAGYVLMPTDAECLQTATAGIRRAIDKLNTRNWNWALTYDDITFVASQTDYTVDNQFKAPRNFDIRDSAGSVQGRLAYLPWQTFLKEVAVPVTTGDPCYYTASNVHATGTVSLDIPPSSGWVGRNPTGRLWFYRRIQYPVHEGTAIDVPSEVIGFIQAFAEGFTADRYDPEKASFAYARSGAAFGDIVRSDNDIFTDWE